MRILCFLLLFVNSITNAQKFTLSGKVNDSNLLPLAGASILVDDNKQGVSSDNSGEFSLNLEQGNYLQRLPHQSLVLGEDNQDQPPCIGELQLTDRRSLPVLL